MRRDGVVGRKGSGLRGNVEVGGGLNGPRGAFFDALRMVGKAAIDELQESVALAGRDVEGEITTSRVEDGVKLAAKAATLGWRRRGGAVDGRTVGCGAGGEWNRSAVGQDDLVETDLGDVKGREVASERSVDAALVVGVKIDDAAGDDGVFGQKELVVGVDRVEKASADWLARAHGVMPIDGERERRARRNCFRRRLA